MKKHPLIRFQSAQDGVAYLEFAISMPVLIILLMAAIEMTRYVIIAQKTEKTAFTLSDVISQRKTLAKADLDNMIYASSQIMLPYTMGPNGRVIISSVKQIGAYSSGNLPTIQWQYLSQGVNGSLSKTSQLGINGGNAGTGDSIVLPSNLTLNDQDNVIVTEVYYNYQPLIATNGILSNSTIYKVAVFKPRLGDLSTCTGC